MSILVSDRSGLPRIQLGDLKVSRLIAGSNPIAGFSHAGRERDADMIEYFTVDRIKSLLASCEAHGINTVVARADRFTMRYLAEYWREGGAIQWIAQTAPEYRDARTNIRQAHAAGASAIYVHGGEVDRFVQGGDLDEIRQQVEYIKDLGLPAGVAAHDPDELLRIQAGGIPVDYFMVCLYNISGYRGKTEQPKEEFLFADRAIALAAIQRLNRPCIAYKVLGAGRLTLEDGLADVRQALRPCDGVMIGMFPPDMNDMVSANVNAVSAMSESLVTSR